MFKAVRSAENVDSTAMLFPLVRQRQCPQNVDSAPTLYLKRIGALTAFYELWTTQNRIHSVVLDPDVKRKIDSEASGPRPVRWPALPLVAKIFLQSI